MHVLIIKINTTVALKLKVELHLYLNLTISKENKSNTALGVFTIKCSVEFDQVRILPNKLSKNTAALLM